MDTRSVKRRSSHVIKHKQKSVKRARTDNKPTQLPCPDLCLELWHKIWTSIHDSEDGDTLLCSWVTVSKEWNTWIHDIVTHLTLDTSTSNFSYPLMVRGIKHYKRLRSLHIICYGMYKFCKIPDSTARGITSLVVSHTTPMMTYGYDYASLIKPYTKLEVLRIPDITLIPTWIPSLAPTLRILECRFGIHNLHDLSIHLPNLNTLYVHTRIPWVANIPSTVRNFSLSVSGLSKVAHFNFLNHCHNGHFVDIGEIENCPLVHPTIEEMTFNNVRFANSHDTGFMPSLASSFPNVQKLTMNQCEFEDLETSISFYSQFPNERMTLSVCD
jgi:hypothetical protein